MPSLFTQITDQESTFISGGVAIAIVYDSQTGTVTVKDVPVSPTIINGYGYGGYSYGGYGYGGGYGFGGYGFGGYYI
ncbi:MAG: hypothetical protein VKL59_07550 [Nostocaceae cyanobacterium]|nr:hypothetical protein [Nostocaceae cyanobacterium]